jgi:AraC-like DNA-binding protein
MSSIRFPLEIREPSHMTAITSLPSPAPARERHRHYSVAPILGGIEQLQAEYERHRFAPHAQETAVIGVVLHGEAVVHGAHCTLPIKTGDVLVIPPRILHDAHSLGSDTWQYRALYLTTAQIAMLSNDDEDGRGVLADRPFVVSNSALVERILGVQRHLQQVETAGAAPALDSLRELITTLRSASEELLGGDAAARHAAAGITRVRRFIDDNPLEKLSLADMARRANLSRFTFAHAFTRAYGVSPHAYALQRKVIAARSLIQQGEAVSSVAHRTGFADQAHLTRRFLSVVGVTPGEFRRAWHGTQRVPRPAMLSAIAPSRNAFGIADCTT